MLVSVARGVFAAADLAMLAAAFRLSESPDDPSP
jgi:hypothetical protein